MLNYHPYFQAYVHFLSVNRFLTRKVFFSKLLNPTTLPIKYKIFHKSLTFVIQILFVLVYGHLFQYLPLGKILLPHNYNRWDMFHGITFCDPVTALSTTSYTNVAIKKQVTLSGYDFWRWQVMTFEDDTIWQSNYL